MNRLPGLSAPRSGRALATVLTAALLSSAAAQVGYTYDNLGRLKSVTDATGATAIYTYDAVGNILSIQRVAAGTVYILGVTPTQGFAATATTVGSAVTISGSGFSATAAQNIVKFNGTTATVDSATSTQLTTHVPLGATTGPITVQVGTSTVTSPSFSVISSLPMTLSALVGKPDEVLTLSATGFPTQDPTLKVYFNSSVGVLPLSVSASTITVKVPAGFTPGPITVSNNAQVFKSAGDFYPMPSGAIQASASVKTAGAITPDTAAKRITTAAPGDSSLTQVPLSAGGELTVKVVPQVAGATDTATLNLYAPQGNLLKTLSFQVGSASSVHLDPADLPSSGVYTIVIANTTSAGFDVNLSTVGDASTALTLNTASPFGPTQAGQYLKLPLAAPEPGPVQLAFSGVILGGGGAATLRQFGGATVPLTAGSSAVLDNLNDTTPTRLRLEPGATTTMSGSLTATGTQVKNLAVGATPVPYTAVFPSQWFSRKFTATAGQALGVTISDLNAPGGSGNASISATTPSGNPSTFYSGTFIPTLIIPTPGAGVAAITVTPLSGATGNTMNVQVGPSTPLTLGAAAQVTSSTDAHAFAHFNVASTDKIQVVVNSLTFGSATGQGQVRLQRPDNFYTSSNATSGANMVFRVDGATASGLYALTIDPPPGGPVSSGLRLMTSAPTVQDDLPVTLSSAVVNEAVVHNFVGAAATPRSLIVRGMTFTGTGNGRLYLFLPGGNSTSISLPSGANWMFGNLNLDGPYTMLLVPPAGGTVSGGQLQVATSTTIVKGTPRTITAAAAGKGFTTLYAGTAGENLGLTLSGLAFTPTNTNPATVMVFRPDGNLLTSFTATSAAGTAVNLSNLPVTGNYIFSVFPPGGTTTGTLSLSADVTAALMVGAAATNFAAPLAGQNARATFTGSVNQNLKLVFSGVSFTGATGSGTVKLYRPDGVQIIWTPNTFTAGATTTVNLPTLTAAGTYNLVIEGPGISTSNFNVQLATR